MYKISEDYSFVDVILNSIIGIVLIIGSTFNMYENKHLDGIQTCITTVIATFSCIIYVGKNENKKRLIASIIISLACLVIGIISIIKYQHIKYIFLEYLYIILSALYFLQYLIDFVIQKLSQKRHNKNNCQNNK